MTTIARRKIERVAIVDDNQIARDGLSYPVEDLKMTAVPETGPLGSLRTSVSKIQKDAQAALCDFRLKVSDYAVFDGAELVAALYRSNTPAVLCTSNADMDQIRPFRQCIPFMITETVSEELVMKGFELCIKELRKEFVPSRKPWRTLVRVQSINKHYSYVILPGWSASKKIRLLRKHVPARIDAQMAAGFRCYAHVNVGSENGDDLYFSRWESFS